MLEESRERGIECIRLLEIRHMPGARDDHVFGAGDRLVHLLAEGRRRQCVLFADDDERRTVNR